MNWNFLSDWQFWLALVTAIVAIIALIQAKHQTKLSNKQHLFDQRVEIFSVAKELYDFYLRNKQQLKYDNKPISCATNLILLTQTDYLHDLFGVYPPNLGDKNKAKKDKINSEKFAKKWSEMTKISSKFEFLFDNSEDLKEFVLAYANILSSMYNYEYFWRNDIMQASKDSRSLPPADIVKIEEWKLLEEKYREPITDNVGKLDELSKKISQNDTIETITKQIKLK